MGWPDPHPLSEREGWLQRSNTNVCYACLLYYPGIEEWSADLRRQQLRCNLEKETFEGIELIAVRTEMKSV